MCTGYVNMKYLEIKNKANILQISDQYQNMVLEKIIGFHYTIHVGGHQSIPLSSTSSMAWWQSYPSGSEDKMWEVCIPITSDIEKESLLFAVSSSVEISGIQFMEGDIPIDPRRTNKIHAARISITFANPQHKYEGHKYVKIYVFSTAVKHKGKSGLEVMSETGDVLFNSNYHYLNIKDVIVRHYEAGNKEYTIPKKTYQSINNLIVAVLSTAMSYGNYSHRQQVHIKDKTIWCDYKKGGRGNVSSWIYNQSTVILVCEGGNLQDFPVSYETTA